MQDRLQVGRRYVARGPAPDSKLGPPPEVTVVGVDEEAGRYQTEGARQVAPVIAFGCEAHWREVLA